MKFLRRLTSFLIFVAYILSASIFSYLIIAQFIELLAPKDVILDIRLTENSYIKFLLSTAFITAGMGILLSVSVQLITFVRVLAVPLREKFAYILISFFLATFYLSSYSSSLLKIFFQTALISMFLLFTPTLISFYSMIHPFGLLRNVLADPEAHSKKSWLGILTNICQMAIASIVLISVLMVIVNIIRPYALNRITKENIHRSTLYIRTVRPVKTIHASGVILEGYNFGWRPDDRWKLLSSDGEITPDLWTDTKIEFTVPLNMKTGERNLWIQKPLKDDHPDGPVTQSNKKTITVLSRFVILPAAGDSLQTRALKRVKKIIFEHMAWSRYFFFDSY